MQAADNGISWRQSSWARTPRTAHRDGRAEMGDIKTPPAVLDSSSALKTAGAEILLDTLDAKKTVMRDPGVPG